MKGCPKVSSKKVTENCQSNLSSFCFDVVVGALDFIAINHFTAWYVIDSNIEKPPFVGNRTCPPIRDENPTNEEWRDFVASQLTGRGAPTFVDGKEEENSGKVCHFRKNIQL